jgi:hypothetical protein
MSDGAVVPTIVAVCEASQGSQAAHNCKTHRKDVQYGAGSGY